MSESKYRALLVEPVAWLNVAADSVTNQLVVVMDWDDEGDEVQSLYLHPPAAQVAELVGALELMKATYPYSPPCHDWEEQVKAHKAASSALAKYRGEL